MFLVFQNLKLHYFDIVYNGFAAAVSCNPILLYLYDIQTHVNNMLSAGAVISGTGVAFQSIAEVTTVQVVVPQIIMASSEVGKGKKI